MVGREVSAGTSSWTTGLGYVGQSGAGGLHLRQGGDEDSPPDDVDERQVGGGKHQHWSS